MAEFFSYLHSTNYPHYDEIAAAWDSGDIVIRRVLAEYGAVLVAGPGVTPPDRLFYKSESEVHAFQTTLNRKSERIGAFEVELQTAAFLRLKDAIRCAANVGLSISPRGEDSSRRGYNETVSLWL